MSVVCRMCLHQIYDESFVSVNDNSVVKDQLSQCIPEMIMTLVTNPTICTSCTTTLDFVYNFKSRCLQMERRILNHLNGAASAIDGTQLADILYASLNREIKCEIGDSSELDMAQESCLTATYCSNDEMLTGGYARNENSSEICFEPMKHNAEELEFKPCQFVDASSIATMEDEADLCDTTEIFKNTNLPGFDEHPVSDSSIDSNKPWKNGLKGKHKDILHEVAAVGRELLPVKTSSRYEKEYQDFTAWRKSKDVEDANEDVLLCYLSGLSKSFAPNSLWTKFSMLKTCLKLHENVDVSRYGKVFTFLKSKSESYKPRKAKILTGEQVTRFLLEAPDVHFLLEKVVLLFGIFGACCREELLSLSVDNIEDTGRLIIVTLENTKTRSCRKFTITEDDTPFKGCTLYRAYATLRPIGLQSRRVFVDYRKGKCTRQLVGIHKIGGVPKKIAEFLKLENPGSYTGHCFRRSSATMLAKHGGDFLTIKTFGGWKSSAVAEQYVEELATKKVKISKELFNPTDGASTVGSFSSCRQ